jgi:histidinol-phosphate aminotransferase
MQKKEYIAALPAMKPPRGSANVVRLSSNENALGPSPLAIAAMQEVLSGIHRYPDATAWDLRQALAERAGLAPETVICSNGSDELLLLSCLAMLREGDEAVMAQGTFVSYGMRTQEMGAQAVRVPLRADYSHDLEAMLAAISPRTRMVFVCNPNNPTGTIQEPDEIRHFLAQVPEHVLVLMDEAYIDFVSRPDHANLLPELRSGRPNLLLLRTFAKIYGLAGIRLGYAYGAPDLISYLDRSRSVFNVNALAQAAGLAALTDHEHVARSREHAARSRAYLADELRALGLRPLPGETNFLAVEIGEDGRVAEQMREAGFAVTPLSHWGLPGLLRISFGTDDENQRFVAALRRVLSRSAAC